MKAGADLGGGRGVSWYCFVIYETKAKTKDLFNKRDTCCTIEVCSLGAVLPKFIRQGSAFNLK